ncbi:hypothetical protein QBC36DRAFT_339196 [Triangularia setosa]|uniref:Uncharacterized protein n=1 Tax=Triangularia setosa TaxID=2587417 RepID=A0AAN6VYZ6_9PEZI|nr:hypothetical protein QBC36DRAFT_339196 [Podospora setosa]
MGNKSHASGTTNNSTNGFTLDSELSLKQSTLKESQSYYPESSTETKPKSSRLSRFLSKLQSPAVRAGSQLEEKDKEEEKRTGVKKKDNSENPYSSALVSDYRYVL